MGLLQDWIKNRGKNKAEFKEKFRAAQEEDKIIATLNERKKSANQRELERWEKEQYEKRIKMKLDNIHKNNNKEMWKSKNLILGQKTNILKDDRPILKEKNIFMENKSMIKKGDMFFKW